MELGKLVAADPASKNVFELAAELLPHVIPSLQVSDCMAFKSCIFGHP